VRARADETYGGALFGATPLLMGLLVAVLGFAVVMMWVDARNNDKNTSSVATTTAAMPGMDMGSGAGTLTSFAGAAPANAAQRRQRARDDEPLEKPSADRA
jgi:hypothetical protein